MFIHRLRYEMSILFLELLVFITIFSKLACLHLCFYCSSVHTAPSLSPCGFDWIFSRRKNVSTKWIRRNIAFQEAILLFLIFFPVFIKRTTSVSVLVPLCLHSHSSVPPDSVRQRLFDFSWSPSWIVIAHCKLHSSSVNFCTCVAWYFMKKL